MFIKLKKISFNEYLILLLPFFLISGPFLPDLVCTYLGLYVLINSIREKNFFFYKNFIFYYFIFIFIYLNINSLFSFNPFISFKSSLTYIRIIFFIFALSFFLKKNINLFLYFFISSFISFAFLFFDSIYQFITSYNLLGKNIDTSRISSFFGDELIMGSFVIRLLPVIIGTLYMTSLKKKEIFCFFITLVSGILIILSGERTAFFLYLIFLIFYFYFFRKQIIYFIIIFSFCLIILSIVKPKLFERIVNHTYQQHKQTEIFISHRHQLHFLTAYLMFEDNKIFGHGIKSFRYLCDSYKYESIIKEKILNDPRNINSYYINEFKNGCNNHPHNIYFEFLAELGILGLLIFSLIFFYISLQLIKLIIKFKKKQKDRNYFSLLFISYAVFQSMFPFITSGSYFNNWLLIINYLPIGFYLSLLKIKNV